MVGHPCPEPAGEVRLKDVYARKVLLKGSFGAKNAREVLLKGSLGAKNARKVLLKGSFGAKAPVRCC